MRKNSFLQTTVLIIVVLVGTYIFGNGLIAIGVPYKWASIIGPSFMLFIAYLLAKSFQTGNDE